MSDLKNKLRDLLEPRLRRRVALIGVLIILMGILEAASIGAVMPFLALTSNPSAIHGHWASAALYERLDFRSTDEFLLALGVAILLFIVLGLIFKAMTYRVLTRFTADCTYTLSTSLFRIYLSQPYIFFLSRHSGDLGKSILNEVHQVTTTVIMALLLVAAHSSTVIFLLGVLIWANPLAALLVGTILGGTYLLIYLGLRRFVSRLGYERVGANRERHRIAQETFGGIKEIKTSGLEHAYLAAFRKPSRSFSMHQATNQIIAELPRYVIEGVSVACIFGVILFMLASGGGLQDILPTLGVYAFAGMRLLPALQQVYRNAVTLQFGRPALDVLHDDFRQKQTQAIETPQRGHRPPALPLTRDLTLSHLHYAYPNMTIPALQDISLTIPARTTVGLVGPSGAGKTTMVDLIMGLLEPTEGTITIDGTPLTEDSRRAWQSGLGYVPQHIFLADETIAANIAFGVPPEDIDMAAVERAARFANLHDFIVTQMPHGYATQVGERGTRLSGGQRQRVGIARALYSDPGVLILDEATSALDNRTERAIMEAVTNIGRSKTIIMIAHRLSTVRNCDHIFVFEKGRLQGKGTYDELLATNATFRAMAGADRETSSL